MTARPRRVAILGAGPAGLATAWHLSDPALGGRYEVTIYCVGWRAGGLCATGRVGPENWVNQNGTHYLFGGFAHTLSLMRGAYAALRQRGDLRFGTFEEQLIPRDLVVARQFYNGRWHDWQLRLPTNNLKPGERGGRASLHEFQMMALQAVAHWLLGAQGVEELASRGLFPRALRPDVWDSPLGALWARATDGVGKAAGHLLRLAIEALRNVGRRTERGKALAHRAAVGTLRELRARLGGLLADAVDRDIGADRLWTFVDLGLTVVIGLIEEGIEDLADLDSLDDLDLRAWLLRWGASERAAQSPLLTVWYSGIAAYEEGDTARPLVSAGLSLKGAAILLTTYRGSFAYQIGWEIGDSFIAPLVEALRQRGVRIAFFHRVWDLVPDARGEQIERVRIERQTTLRSGDPFAYDPFILIRDRPVWPDEPRWEQLSDPPGGLPYDSFYRPRTGELMDLVAGRDFDLLVGALGGAVYRFHATQLAEQKPVWRHAIAHQHAVETQSLRLWWRPRLEELGWTLGPPILSGYVQPYNTWEDPTPVLESETWPADRRPQTVSHFFGPLRAPRRIPGPEDPEHPRRQQHRAEEQAAEWMRHAPGALWPLATDRRDPTSADPRKLVFVQVRANAGPEQAYTMALPGTLRYRLSPGGTGYHNFFVVGDWTRNGVDVGSVESATASAQRLADLLTEGAKREGDRSLRG